MVTVVLISVMSGDGRFSLVSKYIIWKLRVVTVVFFLILYNSINWSRALGFLVQI